MVTTCSWLLSWSFKKFSLWDFRGEVCTVTIISLHNTNNIFLFLLSKPFIKGDQLCNEVKITKLLWPSSAIGFIPLCAYLWPLPGCWKWWVVSAGHNWGAITLLTKRGHAAEQHIHHLASSRLCRKDNTHCCELTFARGYVCVCMCNWWC